MAVIRILQLGEARRDRGKQIVDGDIVLCHHLCGGSVAVDNRSGGVLPGNIRQRSGVSPDQLRAGPLHSLDELFEPTGVIGDQCVAIMDAEVQMNDVPLPVAEPDVDLLQPGRGRSAVGRSAMNVRLASQFLSDGLGISSLNRITDQQHAWQSRIIFDKVPGIGLTSNFLPLVNR